MYLISDSGDSSNQENLGNTGIEIWFKLEIVFALNYLHVYKIYVLQEIVKKCHIFYRPDLESI